MGFELTFSNRNMLYVGDGVRDRASRIGVVLDDASKKRAVVQGELDKMRAIYREKCRVLNCTLPKAHDIKYSFRVEFNDGWHMDFTTDQNVLEILGPPMAVRDIELNEKRLQTSLFDIMEENGLRPTSQYGSGHINVDFMTAFDGDIDLLTSFANDFFNHPGLQTGIFELDPYNAPRLRLVDLLKMGNIEGWQKVVSDVREGKIKTTKGFLRAINTKGVFDYNAKKIALNLTGLDNDVEKQRIELRGFRAQRTAREYTLQTKMIEARIGYVKTLHAEGKKVGLIKDVGVNSPVQAMSQFYYYVTDAGLDYQLYREEMLRGPWKLVPAHKNRVAAYREGGWCDSLFLKAEKLLYEVIVGRDF